MTGAGAQAVPAGAQEEGSGALSGAGLRAQWKAHCPMEEQAAPHGRVAGPQAGESAQADGPAARVLAVSQRAPLEAWQLELLPIHRQARLERVSRLQEPAAVRAGQRQGQAEQAPVRVASPPRQVPALLLPSLVLDAPWVEQPALQEPAGVQR